MSARWATGTFGPIRARAVCHCVAACVNYVADRHGFQRDLPGSSPFSCPRVTIRVGPDTPLGALRGEMGHSPSARPAAPKDPAPRGCSECARSARSGRHGRDDQARRHPPAHAALLLSLAPSPAQPGHLPLSIRRRAVVMHAVHRLGAGMHRPRSVRPSAIRPCQRRPRRRPCPAVVGRPAMQACLPSWRGRVPRVAAVLVRTTRAPRPGIRHRAPCSAGPCRAVSTTQYQWVRRP